jgi:hypothetical protein
MILTHVDHPYLRPKSIHDAYLVSENATAYLYFGCIDFINSVHIIHSLYETNYCVRQVKTATLPWHSPLLNDISGAKSWLKIQQGLLRMYRDNVVAKLPVMQHFLLGRLIGNIGVETMVMSSDAAWNAPAYTPSSGGHLAAQSHVHHGDCTHHHHEEDNQSGHHDDDANVPPLQDGVVKYVKGPSGQWIPIKASEGVYAMGQMQPEYALLLVELHSNYCGAAAVVCDCQVPLVQLKSNGKSSPPSDTA